MTGMNEVVYYNKLEDELKLFSLLACESVFSWYLEHAISRLNHFPSWYSVYNFSDKFRAPKAIEKN